jgi:hypothetical protein
MGNDQEQESWSMMRYGKMLILCGTVAALGMAGREAHATFLVEVTATLNPPSANPNTVTYTVGQSSVTLASNPATTDLNLSSTAPAHDAFASTTLSSTNITGSDAFGAGYSWTLTFTHVNIVNGQAVASGASATTTVAGTLTGTVSAFGTTLTNTFTGGPLATPQALTIDGTTIFVMLDPFTPPGTPTSPPTPTLDFSVAISNQGFQPVPEPGTMALLGLGVGLVALKPLRLRRAAKKAA